MADIVERLRAEIEFVQGDAAGWGVDTYGDLPRTLALLREAADSITQLRKERDEALENIAELSDGRRAILPHTKEHALNLYAVAIGCLKGYGEDVEADLRDARARAASAEAALAAEREKHRG